MSNRLLFDLDSTIIVVANNRKDLEDYLESEFDWFEVKFLEDSVAIKPNVEDSWVNAKLTWIKDIS